MKAERRLSLRFFHLEISVHAFVMVWLVPGMTTDFSDRLKLD
jgi:hypothetical protein